MINDHRPTHRFKTLDQVAYLKLKMHMLVFYASFLIQELLSQLVKIPREHRASINANLVNFTFSKVSVTRVVKV